MKLLIALCVSLALLVSCSKEKTAQADTQSDFSVYLTDGPGNFDAVYIDIQSVEVQVEGQEGWVQLRTMSPGIKNLLNFRNGRDTILATAKMASQKITAIRLILGDQSAVVINNETIPLETPSGQESGIKVLLNEQLTEGVEYTLWLDFDCSRSIVKTGNGKYILKPVIRAYTKAISGSIKGMVVPSDADAWIYAIQNTNDTIASAKPEDSGYFLIGGLTEGNYKIAIDGNDNYMDTTIQNVTVTNGAQADVGTIQLHQ